MEARATILDIAMNLNRMGNWAADDYNLKKERIKTFLKNTNQYLQSLKKTKFPAAFKATFSDFEKEYFQLEGQEKNGLKDPLEWAEKMMTWGNILTHRVSLLA